MILRAFIDDSGTNQLPICVLAGWIGPADVWARFSDDWQHALEMRPRVAYFRMAEAMTLGGEFSGWSAESRDFRLRYLANLIQEHPLVGVGVSLPLAKFHSIFKSQTNDKAFDQPYLLMLYTLVASIHKEIGRHVPSAERIDFVFDEQPGQMERISEEWGKLRNVAPEHLKRMIGDPPIYRSDKTTVALQAADLWAWYVRISAIAEETGKSDPPKPWAPAGANLNTVTWYWTEEKLQSAFNALTGVTPPSALVFSSE